MIQRKEIEKKKRKKKKIKKKKHNKKDDGCTTKKCFKLLCKPSCLLWIIAIISGLIGAYFYFFQNKDYNIYAYAIFGGSFVIAIFGCLCWCR